MSSLSNIGVESKFKNSYSRAGSFFKKYTMADTLVSKIIFVIVIIILFFLILRLVIIIMGYIFSPKNSPYIIKGLHDGGTRVIKTQNPSSSNSVPLYRSKNELGGIELSYSIWLNIKDKKNTDSFNHIFSKGSIKRIDDEGVYYPNNFPGLYFNGTSSKNTNINHNELVAIVNTYNNESERIIIENIPLEKWIFVVLRIKGNILDVYINGIITKRHVLSGVPKQNYEPIIVSAGKNNGFDGQLSNLRYYDYALSAIQINSLALQGPNLKADKIKDISTPPYLATNWYFNNNN